MFRMSNTGSICGKPGWGCANHAFTVSPGDDPQGCFSITTNNSPGAPDKEERAAGPLSLHDSNPGNRRRSVAPFREISSFIVFLFI